jgi:hypothetical protein
MNIEYNIIIFTVQVIRAEIILKYNYNYDVIKSTKYSSILGYLKNIKLKNDNK